MPYICKYTYILFVDLITELFAAYTNNPHKADVFVLAFQNWKKKHNTAQLDNYPPINTLFKLEAGQDRKIRHCHDKMDRCPVSKYQCKDGKLILFQGWG